MNNQEWTKKRMESYASVGELCAAINAALTAERERYGALELEHDRMAGYAMESVSKLEAAVSEIQQLRKQLAAEREKVQTLVDALKKCVEELEESDGVDGIGDPVPADPGVIAKAKAVLAKVSK